LRSGDTDDGLRADTQSFADALGIPMHNLDGKLDGYDYWREHYGPYLRFYADALATC
jgi:hypothetical protein